METFTGEKKKEHTWRFNHQSDNDLVTVTYRTVVSLSMLNTVKLSSVRQSCAAVDGWTAAGYGNCYSRKQWCRWRCDHPRLIKRVRIRESKSPKPNCIPCLLDCAYLLDVFSDNITWLSQKNTGNAIVKGQHSSRNNIKEIIQRIQSIYAW